MGTRNLHKIDSSQSCFWNQSFFGVQAVRLEVDGGLVRSWRSEVNSGQ
jgi:hypothetical protein